MPYPIFDRARLTLKPLAERQHDMTLADVLPLDAPIPPFSDPALPDVAARIAAARRRGAPVVLMMGAHVIKRGLSRFVIAMLEENLVTHAAMNGAGPIHDFELALTGATTESVARYIRTGEFGLWQETGRINDAILAGAEAGLGMGEAIGQAIATGNFPHREVSILAAGVRLGVPVTVHVGIGYDIIHEHPNCDGAALGATSYRDFLIFAHTISRLEGGILLNLGTSVMGPEVYLKALSLARNIARQEGREIRRFTTAVFDLIPWGDDQTRDAPQTDPGRHYGPYTT